MDLRKKGVLVESDLKYFEGKRHINCGKKNQGLSRFPWQLDCFGLSINTFATNQSQIHRISSIQDGSRKLALFAEAIQSDEIRKLFNMNSPNFCQIGQKIFSKDSYICLHLRRGDYVSVASHVIPIQDYAQPLSACVQICKTIVVVSDSVISDKVIKTIKSFGFKEVINFASVSEVEAFWLMQNASMLIAANSQFSFAAGMTSGKTFFMPHDWIKGKSIRDLAIKLLENDSQRVHRQMLTNNFILAGRTS